MCFIKITVALLNCYKMDAFQVETDQNTYHIHYFFTNVYAPQASFDANSALFYTVWMLETAAKSRSNISLSAMAGWSAFQTNSDFLNST